MCAKYKDFKCDRVFESTGKVSKIKIDKEPFELWYEMNEYLCTCVFLTLCP